MLSREFDFAVTEKREELKQVIDKDMVLCDGCSEPIVPYDQYLWVADKLGPLVFSNASLMLFYMRFLSLALKEKEGSGIEGEYQRFDRIKILCPECRRKAVLKS